MIEERECKKCHVEKKLEDFNIMINGGYSYDCKLCRSAYNQAYALLNRTTIRSNERIRKGWEKTNKQYKDMKNTVEYHRKPTIEEIKNDEGVMHYKDFTLEQTIKKDGEFRKWLVCPVDGLRYYR